MEHRLENRRGGAEARLRAVLESLSEGVVAADATGHVVSWNRAALELFGFAREEDWLVDLSALAVHFELFERDGEPVPLEGWPLAKLLQGESQRDRVLEVRRRGTDWRRTLSFSGSRTHGRDGHDLAVLSFTDITEKLSLEEQVRQAQKLDSIGRLAGGVAHDFNNVLTVILSSAGALQRDLAQTGKVDASDLKEILDAGQRARDLVRHLLAFARKQVLSPVVLDLGEILRGSEKLLRRLIGEDVALSLEVEPGLWPVFADGGAIEQAVMNLAVNARDAMPRGGRLAIAARNVPADQGTAAGRRPGEWVEVAVSDSGVGMPASVVAHLFEPFFTTKEAGRGTGLGLATVHGTATQAGGYVRVESAPGAGSTFTLALPRCHRTLADRTVPAVGEGPRGTETVLLVEDDAVVRTVAARALARAGYHVLEAAGGPAALALVAAHAGPIHLVLADVVLEGAWGPAVVEQLTARLPGLRAMFVSGHPRDALARRGVLAPGVPFLEKPFTPEALLASVRAVLDARAPRPRRPLRARAPALAGSSCSPSRPTR